MENRKLNSNSFNRLDRMTEALEGAAVIFKDGVYWYLCSCHQDKIVDRTSAAFSIIRIKLGTDDYEFAEAEKGRKDLIVDSGAGNEYATYTYTLIKKK